MRPDQAAFRELDTLVRNLTDQLTGYRRRALSAESRARELELHVASLMTAVDEAQREATASQEAREHALAAAREATATARSARDALGVLEQRLAAATSSDTSPNPAVPVQASDEIVAENENLRQRLSEARDRTAQLADRVRFLRQQIVQGAER